MKIQAWGKNTVLFKADYWALFWAFSPRKWKKGRTRIPWWRRTDTGSIHPR